jgi:hypothetical protein
VAIPAYARDRIAYLNYRYFMEPKIRVRQSYREGAVNKFRVKDSLIGEMFKNEKYRIVDSYDSTPKSKPSEIAARLKHRQKEAVQRALKQVEEYK